MDDLYGLALMQILFFPLILVCPGMSQDTVSQFAFMTLHLRRWFYNLPGSQLEV